MDTKQKFKKTLRMVLIGMLALSLITISRFSAQTMPANAMWIEPSSINLTTNIHTIGYKFNVTVWINLTVTCWAWQFKMLYNKAQLNATRCGYTAGTRSQFFQNITTIPIAPAFGSYNSTHDYVMHGETWGGSGPMRAPGYGSLSWVEFEVIAVPSKAEVLTSVISISNVDTYALDATGTKIPLTRYDSLYTFTWVVPPTNPYLAVDPAYVVFDRYENVTCRKFNVTVLIKELHVAWELTNASFCLQFNTTLIDIQNYWVNDFWGGFNIIITHDVPWDMICVNVTDPATVPSGDIPLIIIEFHVVYQGSSPPRPLFDYDETPLFFCSHKLMDHYIEIPTRQPVEGLVRIYCLMFLTPPWLEVEPTSINYGPEPSIGTEFNVNILIKNLDMRWWLVAIEFRLGYNSTLLEVVSVTEGPFLKDPRWNWYGTYFVSFIEPDGTYGPHIHVGNVLFPNPVTGEWDQTEFPNGQGTVATIRFRVIYQGVSPEVDSCVLDLFNVKLIDKYHSDIPSGEPVDGTYTIKGLLGFVCHDIAITSVKPYKTVVGQGYCFTANITIANRGNFTETFRLFSTCGFIRNLTLPSGAEIIVENLINTTNLRKGKYGLYALIPPCFDDCNPCDNIRIEGNFTVAMIGDITGGTPNVFDFVPDGKVDMKDIGVIAKYFGKNVPPAPSNCDLTGPIVGVPDYKVDMRDIGVAAKNFGKIDP